VDDRIDAADSVGVRSELPDVRQDGQVSDEAVRPAVHQVLHRGEPAGGPRMHDHVMAVPEQRLRRRKAQPVS